MTVFSRISCLPSPNYLTFSEIFTGDGTSKDIPIGWRFVPTDEELIVSYLSNKVALRSLPAKIIKEIDATEFYSKHPKDLVESACSETDRYCEKERYFFIHEDQYFHGKVEKDQPVGDGIGFWRFAGKEEPIYDADGNIFACKIHSTFFSADLKFRRTHWTMEEYRLINTDNCRGDKEELPREEWVVARISSGNVKAKEGFL